MKSGCPSEKFKMYVLLFLYLNLLLALMACSVKYPWYDEVIGLTPELAEDGNSLIRTQTLWSKGPEVIMLQAVTIDEQQVGVKYLYNYDFKKLPNFPEDFSFGKRLVIVPPGNHISKISYTRQGSYLQYSMNQKYSRLISYIASIPADSICVLLPEVESYRVDLNNPKIRLECRKKQNRK
jgi:hypothetical protein